MRGWSKGGKRHERRKIIISIILSFRKFWGREGSVHQRLFAIWVQKEWYLLTRLIVRKTSTNSKKKTSRLCFCLLQSIWSVFSSPAHCFLLVGHARNSVVKIFSLIVYHCVINAVFFLFHICKYSFGEKKRCCFISTIFLSTVKLSLLFMNVSKGGGVHVEAPVDSWFMNLTLGHSIKRL